MFFFNASFGNSATFNKIDKTSSVNKDKWYFCEYKLIMDNLNVHLTHTYRMKASNLECNVDL